MRSPLRWYGGKGQMLGTLLPLLPPHHTYCEPFAGGAAVFFAKAPAPVEVLNDLDSGLVNFYRVLRDPTTFAAFAQRVGLTPYSREEWIAGRDTWQDAPDPVERAARWFVWVRQSFGGGGQAFAGWQHNVTFEARTMSSNVANWLTAVEILPAVHARLQAAQIEHVGALRTFDLYDTPATLFYCDPPYVQEERGRHRYAHELTLEQHALLVARLLTVRGMVVLSGYAHAVYAPLEAAGWERRDIATAAHTVQTRGAGAGLDQAGRVETIWRNPACVTDFGPLFREASA